MNMLLRWVGAIALALCPSLVTAQSQAGKSIVAPMGAIPATAIYCDDGTGHAVVCSSSGASGGDASAANQTSIQALPGNDAAKAIAVQGVTGGKAIAVSPSATENHLGEVGGRTQIASSSFTTTSLTTAWSANQLIANSAAAASVTPLSFTVCRVTGGTGMLRRARIKVATDTGFAGQSVTLKLYRDPPTASSGDRATWLTTESTYLGQVAVTLDQHFSDFEKGVGAPSVGSEINFDCASGSQVIYGLLVSTGTITPAAGSKAITATLEVLAN